MNTNLKKYLKNEILQSIMDDMKCYLSGEGNCQYTHQAKKDCEFLVSNNYCIYPKENKLLEG